MEIITIKWHGPYKLDYLQNYELSYLNGVYAIYRVWGNCESLLYIGKTERGFEKRLSEHYKDWLFNVRGQIKIRLGLPCCEEGKHLSSNKLSHIESLLISWHEPPENTVSKTRYYGRENLTVINTGRRGALHQRICTDDYE